MKVKELKEKLEKLPPDSRVFIKGYEEGVEDINIITIKRITLYVHNESFYPHVVGEDSNKYPDSKVVTGLVIY